ncbi:Alpha/beta hydrolase fold-1 [Trinorchestia longiramus]|nr:Alpha/beta hydrolase fold-1 [Trinorchestia longiramus]
MSRQLLGKLALAGIALVALGLVFISFQGKDSSKSMPVFSALKAKEAISHELSRSEDMQAADLMAGEIPSSVTSHAKDIPVFSGFVELPEGVQVFYQGCVPNLPREEKKFVLLLHGAAFSSQNWHDLGTLPLLAALGYTAVAIDIPGYGKSKGSVDPSAEFVPSVVKALSAVAQLKQSSLSHPVVVSPSMSGQYSIPLLVADAQTASATPFLTAFIAVAPVSTSIITPSLAPSVKTPTLIVRGSNDKNLGTTSVEDLQRIPGSRVVVIPDAGHPAYINQPVIFHTVLYNFLTGLQKNH